MRKRIAKNLPNEIVEKIKVACNGKLTFSEVRSKFPGISRSAVYACIIRHDLVTKPEKTFTRRRAEKITEEKLFRFEDFKDSLAWS